MVCYSRLPSERTRQVRTVFEYQTLRTSECVKLRVKDFRSWKAGWRLFMLHSILITAGSCPHATIALRRSLAARCMIESVSASSLNT